MHRAQHVVTRMEQQQRAATSDEKKKDIQKKNAQRRNRAEANGKKVAKIVSVRVCEDPFNGSHHHVCVCSACCAQMERVVSVGLEPDDNIESGKRNDLQPKQNE